VCNSAYILQEFSNSWIAESSPAKFERTQKSEWTDEEIAAIRGVLWKLAVVRILNHEDVEDLVQETLLTIVAKPPASELEKGLLVWSLGILRNKVGNYYRKSHRYALLEKIKPDTQQWATRPIASSPETKASDKELIAIVSEKVAEMPSPEREVMELLVAGLDSGEIATHLHPERYQNVINRLHRGRKKLAKELARYGYGPSRLTAMQRARGLQSKGKTPRIVPRIRRL
jgi:RNA polymerase sigma factor (sigma-70 family)